MDSARSRMKAIDLYAGIGGWALGLKLAGIEVVRSYEWWESAAESHRHNLGGEVVVADIRALPLESFPRDVDVIVGSPPCTQFSYSNRGGSGNLQDGLRDVEKFLAVVDHVKPLHWAMENVPRVAGILQEELRPGGSLSKYEHLGAQIRVLDSSEWGVPQRRSRMIAGSFDFDRLLSYRHASPQRTLRDVIDGLRTGGVDPVYGWDTPAVTDNLKEASLSPEEERINREQKSHHRVYNVMPFPDEQDRPARTVTALCTRVSRESIVIADTDGHVRRLSIRERASLQSFPVAYQLQGSRATDRTKMVGNAIPPLLTFNIASSMLGRDAALVAAPLEPLTLGALTDSAEPTQPKRNSRANRSFAFAIPGLRWGSGMRIELGNDLSGDSVRWRTSFHYGPSKHHTMVPLDGADLDRLQRAADGLGAWLEKAALEVCSAIEAIPVDGDGIQRAWASSTTENGPFLLLDRLGETASRVESWLPQLSELESDEILAALLDLPLEELRATRTVLKLRRNSRMLLSGSLVGCLFNDPECRLMLRASETSR